MRPAPPAGKAFGRITTDSFGRIGEPMANGPDGKLGMSRESGGSPAGNQGWKVPNLRAGSHSQEVCLT